MAKAHCMLNLKVGDIVTIVVDKQPCSPETLEEIIEETTPKPRVFPANIDLQDAAIRDSLREINCDEVYPGIYVGDRFSATNIDYLKICSITHVLNVAQGSAFGQVDTNEKYYEPHGIKFLGLKLKDNREVQISLYFEETAKFIDDALNNNGKVLVHCYMGVSRSATIALAYLMLRKGLSAEEALRTVSQVRDILPNSGFLQQLCDLDETNSSNKAVDLPCDLI